MKTIMLNEIMQNLENFSAYHAKTQDLKNQKLNTPVKYVEGVLPCMATDLFGCFIINQLI